ncbi:unnamed protein product [Adineta steineri]|uniref:Tetraspanin n=1 Tax=Adineta steineri TaxID=433720 RepID=A0A815CU82_9BILA|nr:unnamed protein product [Adineta steineri]CAF3630802.1 unnamed protein product [Adineta steineri]
MSRFSCGIQCTRTILFILNILFFIFGIILLGFGIYINVNKKLDIALSEHLNTRIIGGNALEDVGYILIIVAVFTILLSAFGCLGSIFKNRVFLYLYAVILSLLIITELAAFIIILSSRVAIRDSYHSGFEEFFNHAYNQNRTDLTDLIESMEREFKCCGAENVTDYYKNNYTIPSTCHHNNDIHKPIFNQGCAHAVVTWLWNQLPIIASVLCIILLIEIFGVISSIALAIAISHSSYDKLYD